MVSIGKLLIFFIIISVVFTGMAGFYNELATRNNAELLPITDLGVTGNITENVNDIKDNLKEVEAEGTDVFQDVQSYASAGASATKLILNIPSVFFNAITSVGILTVGLIPTAFTDQIFLIGIIFVIGSLLAIFIKFNIFR